MKGIMNFATFGKFQFVCHWVDLFGNFIRSEVSETELVVEHVSD